MILCRFPRIMWLQKQPREGKAELGHDSYVTAAVEIGSLQCRKKSISRGHRGERGLVVRFIRVEINGCSGS